MFQGSGLAGTSFGFEVKDEEEDAERDDELDFAAEDEEEAGGALSELLDSGAEDEDELGLLVEELLREEEDRVGSLAEDEEELPDGRDEDEDEDERLLELFNDLLSRPSVGFCVTLS